MEAPQSKVVGADRKRPLGHTRFFPRFHPPPEPERDQRHARCGRSYSSVAGAARRRLSWAVRSRKAESDRIHGVARPPLILAEARLPLPVGTTTYRARDWNV